MNRLLLYVPVLIIAACEPASEYEAMLKRELNRPDTIRPLFFSYELGMSRQAFYDSSWALNRLGLVTHGPNNMHVQYKLPDELSYPATMLYYPDFEADQIFRMRIRFSYDGWAPWNRHLWSDSLLSDVHQLMETWYGKGFLVKQANYDFIKVDANRQITIQPDNDREVLVQITDLRMNPLREHD